MFPAASVANTRPLAKAGFWSRGAEAFRSLDKSTSLRLAAVISVDAVCTMWTCQCCVAPSTHVPEPGYSPSLATARRLLVATMACGNALLYTGVHLVTLDVSKALTNHGLLVASNVELCTVPAERVSALTNHACSGVAAAATDITNSVPFCAK